MKIIPEGKTAEADSTPLKPTKTKHTEMVNFAKGLMTEVVEFKDVVDALEQHYVFEKNEHYTSAQLKAVVEEAKKEVEPQPVIEEPVVDNPVE